jgi:folate-binding protein YgfZ
MPTSSPTVLHAAPSREVREAATTGALLVQAPHLGTIEVTGPDRQSWLNGLVTSDVAKLVPGRVSYGLVLVKIGRIVSDVYVLPAGDRLLVAGQRDRIALLEEHFEKYLIMEDAAHRDASSEYAWIFAQGPRATEVAAAAAAMSGVAAGTVDLQGAPDGVIAVAIARQAEVTADLVAKFPDVVRGSEDDAEQLRIRRFLPRWGVDFGEKNYPQEAALEKIAVSFNKGCYLGQEVVCRLEMRGHVIKKIVPLRIAGEPPAHGAEVRSTDGKVLGSVSSAVRDDAGAVGLAMVRIDFAEPGTKLDVGGREATVLGA